MSHSSDCTSPFSVGVQFDGFVDMATDTLASRGKKFGLKKNIRNLIHFLSSQAFALIIGKCPVNVWTLDRRTSTT